MPPDDFLFLGHGPVPARASTLWVALEDPRGRIELSRERLASLGEVRGWRADGPVAMVKVRMQSDALRDDALRATHRVTPLGLVVQTGRRGDSPWHRASVAAAPTVLERLERLLIAPDAPYVSPVKDVDGWHGADVNLLLMKRLEGVRAGLAAAALQALERASSKRERAVLLDLLLERLPAWTGRSFEVDVVVRHFLAHLQQLSPSSIELSSRFQEALATRLVAGLGGRSDAAVPADFGGLIDARDWFRLRGLWRDGDESQRQALLALDFPRLATLARNGFATHLANAGTFCLGAQDFERALRFFDGAIEGPLDPRAGANPLFAVQNDTHHLGVMPERARKYLAACLPLAERNPAIWLNAAFVCMELDEPTRALDLLAEAKAAGVKVRAHRNERLFAPLRADPRFQALMR